MFSLKTTERVIKPLAFLACAAPLFYLVLQAFGVAGLSLGPNPIETLQDVLGIWGLRLLLVTLAITPISWFLGSAVIRLRRMLGLFAFTYIALHFINYLVLDQGLSAAAIIEDILERPFITIGAAALLAMIPLAITSTNGWRRRLGRSWVKLHQLTYLIGIAGCWHFYWQVKKDLTEPLIYCAILATLLGARVVRKRMRRARNTGGPRHAKMINS